MTPEEMQELFGGQDPFSDFFHTFFGGEPERPRGGGRAQRSARTARGHDLEQTVDLTLEEAFNGTTRRVVIARDGHERTVDIRIPAGVKDGARVRAAGEGGSASRGGQAGDLYLTVRVLPHQRFERRGQDLHVKMDVPVTTAVLGGEVTVPTLDSPVRLKIPPLTAQGRMFRLRGHGMPSVGSKEDRGDLYATATIQLPGRLSDEQRAHYEALKAIDDRQG
jgi:DnaJ-class molecular chaperone